MILPHLSIPPTTFSPLPFFSLLPATHSLCNLLLSFGAKDTKPCAEDPPVWDPPLEGLIESEQEKEEKESLPGSGSTSDQGSLRDQALDTVDFQPNLELPACLDKLKVKVTHVNSPGSFYVQLTQNNIQLKRCVLWKVFSRTGLYWRNHYIVFTKCLLSIIIVFITFVVITHRLLRIDHYFGYDNQTNVIISFLI